MNKEKTFNEWRDVCYHALENNDGGLRATALEHMTELAKTFDTWLSVHACSIPSGLPNGDDLVATALEKMSLLAETHEDWGWVYGCAPKDSELRAIALKKRAELAEVIV